MELAQIRKACQKKLLAYQSVANMFSAFFKTLTIKWFVIKEIII